MEFQISPLKGVDDIEFGAAPADVRRHFDSQPKSFKRTPQDAFPCDYFESQGVFFYYDGDGRLEAVEFASPARPSVEKLNLLGLGLDEATAALSGLDSEVEKEADGAIAYQLGVSIYAPLAKENPAAPVESVLAFRPGYYN
ncbi:MAG: hypothetical protein ACTHJR_17535 [Sphingomonas sp.]|uniref:hypothetical protein n=1 Tax=Sphingomonas sp. TaxID=28214 RepID=UPI003F802CCF